MAVSFGISRRDLRIIAGSAATGTIVLYLLAWATNPLTGILKFDQTVPAQELRAEFLREEVKPLFVYNHTISLPRGWYRVQAGQAPEAGGVVLVDIPPHWREVFERNGKITSRTRTVIKRYLAGPGARCAIEGGWFVIDGVRISRVQAEGIERYGRCPDMVVPDGHALIGSRHPQGVDSRYLGPVAMSHFIGAATPVWLREGDEEETTN